MKIVRLTALWCPACIVMHQMWQELEQLYPDIEFIKYDIDIDEEMADYYDNPTILPLIVFYRNEQELLKVNGEKNKKELIKIIEDLGV